jgi:hypothetical protein
VAVQRPDSSVVRVETDLCGLAPASIDNDNVAHRSVEDLVTDFRDLERVAVEVEPGDAHFEEAESSVTNTRQNTHNTHAQHNRTHTRKHARTNKRTNAHIQGARTGLRGMLHPRSHSRVGFLVAVLDRDADTVSGFDDQGVRVWIEDGVDRRNGP